MPKPAHLAIDLGAESGRVMVAHFDRHGLTLEQAHRFNHFPIDTPTGLCWDTTGLFREITAGLKHAANLCQTHGWQPVSAGADTWGVDFALLSEHDAILGLPACYRDAAFPAAMQAVHQQTPADDIYAATGIQMLPFNSLYQLHERKRTSPEILRQAQQLLFMPDLIHWMLSGNRCIERTNASTSQMLDPHTGTWNRGLIEKLNLPHHFLTDPVEPGTAVGTLRPPLAAATGLPDDLQIIAPATHDTASAVAAVPYGNPNTAAYLSSGTWSLLGVELDHPLINPDTAAAGFTHELGVAGKVRFLKNIAGLWLVQQSRAQLKEQGHDLGYAELAELAADAQPRRSMFPANHASLAAPGHMVDRIRDLCQACGQPTPDTPGQVIRACLDSLALEYRSTLQSLQQLTGRTFDTLHVVGGGGKNQLLNQLTADATQTTVVVGPYEASAAGNALVQARATGHLDPDATTAQLLGGYVVGTVQPNAKEADAWTQAHAAYQQLQPNA